MKHKGKTFLFHLRNVQLELTLAFINTIINNRVNVTRAMAVFLVFKGF